MNKGTVEQKPIAIVGMSGRFPKAEKLADFWDMLLEGNTSVEEMNGERWDIEKFFDADKTAPGKTNQRHAALLKGIYDFDPYFFNISPAEAVEMNPSQKLMLELVWEAIEDSTLAFRRILGSKTGVYIGNIWSDFEHYRKAIRADITSHSAVGQASNVIANRVSFTYGFSGASLVVDTGCSSSLVALHLACQALWDGSNEYGVVGGVNHILDPDQYPLLTKFGGLSAKGRCSTFDEGADGFVRGEGAGVVILMPMEKAVAEGHRILAVVRGTAMNNNGYNVNLPATSIKGQLDVLEQAYRNSSIKPYEVQYVEAHGTGTQLGDPTETNALGQFFSVNRNVDNKLAIGSVKTNLGHLEGAAGMAGLLKVVLAMKHKILPQNINFSTHNPKIPFDDLLLKVQQYNTPWNTERGETRKAGVNSFGWGGTNAHTILEEYVPDLAIDEAEEEWVDRLVLPLSAKDPVALKELARAYYELLMERADDEILGCREICAATAVRRMSLDYRIAFTAETLTGLRDELFEALHTQELVFAKKAKTLASHKTVFVFPGQGGQWLGMGKGLLANSEVFRTEIVACELAFAPYVDWVLRDEINAVEGESRLQEIDVVQPMLFAVQVGLARYWMSVGVIPDVVVGHSMGEVAAAYIAGGISLEDAAKVICVRSKLMKKLSGQGGAMAVTELTLDEAVLLEKKWGGRLSVAVYNSPKSTVMAGDSLAVEELVADLEGKGLFARQVKVDVASHSKQMDAIKDELEACLRDVNALPLSVPMFSTVENRYVVDNELDCGYWKRNLRNQVQFAAVVQTLQEDSFCNFIEVSPHPVLLNAIEECAKPLHKEVLCCSSLIRNEDEYQTLHLNLLEAYVGGVNVDWEVYYKYPRLPIVELPAYPFQRETYQLEDKSSVFQSFETGLHPLLGRYIAIAGDEEQHIWQNTFDLSQLPFLSGHSVNGKVVLPGVAYLEAAEAAIRSLGIENFSLATIEFLKPLLLKENRQETLQLKITRFDLGTGEFLFFKKIRAQKQTSQWVLLAKGGISFMEAAVPHTASFGSVEELKFSDWLPQSEYYAKLEKLGLYYSGFFRGLKTVYRQENRIVGHIEPLVELQNSANLFLFHPGILDACMQLIFANNLSNDNGKAHSAFLTTCAKAKLYRIPNLTTDFWVEAILSEDVKRSGNIIADVFIYQANQLVYKVNGLSATIIENDVFKEDENYLKEWLYSTKWVKLEQDTSSPSKKKPKENKLWLLMSDGSESVYFVMDKLQHDGFEVLCVENTLEVGEPTEYDWVNGKAMVDFTNSDAIQGLLETLIIEKKKYVAGTIFFHTRFRRALYGKITGAELLDLEVNTSSTLLLYLQQSARIRGNKQAKLVLVTSGLNTTSDKDSGGNIANAALWGFGQTIANELSENYCLRVDLSEQYDRSEVGNLYDLIIQREHRETTFSLRGKEIYTSKLCRPTLLANSYSNAQFSINGTYLITGFGDLAMELLEWMISEGATHFVLTNRSGNTPDKIKNKITAYLKRGILIITLKADVTDFDALQHIFTNMSVSMPPLKGVFHTAGLIDPKTIDELTPDGFRRIVSPKLEGAWNLHRLTSNMRLDYFVLFSSASSLIGLSGQASYVAGNTFLDYLAQYRQSLNLPALSVNWGVMKEVGMVAKHNELEKYALAEGFVAIRMQDALKVFGKVANLDLAQIGIMKINIDNLKNYYNALTKTGHLSELLNTDPTQDVIQSGDLINLIKSTKTHDKRTELIVQIVSQEVALLTKAARNKIRPSTTFKSLGVDSLMAVKLRNSLQDKFNLKLSVTSFWSYPSMAEFSTFIVDELLMLMVDDPMPSIVPAQNEVKAKQPVYPQVFIVDEPSELNVDAMDLDDLSNEMDDLLNGILAD